MMSLETLLIWLVVGAVSGWLVRIAIKGYGIGLLSNMAVGVVGAFLGGWLFGVFGIAIGFGIINVVLTAFIGASVSLLLLSVVGHKRGAAHAGPVSPVVSPPRSPQPSPSFQPATPPTMPASPSAAPARSVRPTPPHQPADVFISYKREERERVNLIAAALRHLGFNVWFDARLTSGHQFDEEINREVRAAKAVLVCWSKASVQSEWVRAEASIGRQRGVLAACFLEQCDPYTPFNLTHAEDLSSGTLDDTNPAWTKIVEQLEQLRERAIQTET